MKQLTVEDIVLLHDQQIDEFGGLKGIRDKGLLEQLATAPYQSFGGQELYPDIYDKAIKYLFGFAQYQVFLDGNKRTAVSTMLAFLFLNGILVMMPSKKLYDMTMQIANHQYDEEDAKDIIKEHSIKV